MNIVPMRWSQVEDRATILGRDGRPVQLGAVMSGNTVTTIEWNGQVLERPNDEIVPVVLPGMGEAVSALFAAFPQSEILDIT